MNTKKLLAAIMAVTLILCMIPFTASAAAEVLMVDGERTAFVSSFGKMTYQGKSYASFKTFKEGLAALGKEGGTIVFTGNIALPDFKDTKGRAPLTIKGIGTKSTGNLLNFSGTADAPVPEVNLEGDIILDFLNIRLDPGAFLFTNGFEFKTRNEFDTYHSEKYVANGDNIITYPNPPSIAPGTITSGVGAITLEAGTYETLAAGSVNGKTVNGNTFVSLEGGTITNVVAGNIGNGTMNGDAKLTIGQGNITKLVAGSMGGTINGNVTTRIDGGEIAEAIIGAEAGATINGSVIVALNGGNFAGQITAGKGTVTGKKIVITGADATLNLASGAADYIIKLAGGLCEPQMDGANVTGFLFTDKYGIPATTATINGNVVAAENGIYQLNAGTNTIAVESKVDVKVNKNSKYVAGYADGTFLPQNNMTRAEAITLLTRIVTDENNIKGKVTANYDDVASGEWFESYIGLFQKLGFLENLEASGGAKILPNQNITRAEFTELLYGVATLGEKAASMKLKNFSDVDDLDKFAIAINYAVANNIVMGYEDGTFRPDANITRAEVVTMANRFMGRTPNGNAGAISFSDIDAHWAKTQILAAAGAENETWTATAADGQYVLTGTNNEERVKALYEQSATLKADAIRAGVDTVAAELKKDILNAPNTADIYGDKMTGQTWYVSEKNGNDENDGKTPETAWKTFAGVSKNIRFPKAGTTILFERGGIYRGQCPTFNGTLYGAYGTGPKPLFIQSKKNYADPALWVETEWPNVWKCTEELINVGVIGFDHDLQDYSDATYDELYGLIMNKDTRGFDGAHELCGDLQFYSDVTNGLGNKGPVYVYSTKGNPGSRFKSIEMGEKIDIFDGAPKGITIDNLSLKFTGGHGIGFGTTSDVRVTNCVFSWLGGSVLSLKEDKSATNYGNAVEIYGGCDGYHVENNWMYQIYDTAVTHQRSAKLGDCYQGNVNYLSNLIEYVYWGIEFYNAPPTADQLGGKKDTYKRLTENVRSAFNILRFGGYGWGSITRYRPCQLYCGSTLSANKNCIAEYNIFDRAAGNLLKLPSNSTEIQDKNIYIQTLGQNLGNLRGVQTTCDFNIADNIARLWGDKNAMIVVIDPEIEPVVLKKPEGLAPPQLDN